MYSFVLYQTTLYKNIVNSKNLSSDTINLNKVTVSSNTLNWSACVAISSFLF